MLQLEEIQGLILRSYRMPALRVFVLQVEDPARFGEFLAGIASGDEIQSPQLTTASQWQEKPQFTLNLGFTAEGLRAIGTLGDSMTGFPEDFRQGAVARALKVGDTGANAPETWTGGLNRTDVHALLVMYAQSTDVLEAESTRLRALLKHGATIISEQTGLALENEVAHFGYRDGLAQPTIEGGLPAPLKEPFDPTKAGAFVLGHDSQFEGFRYPVPDPPEFGLNGSYLAYRVLEQDCHGFETLLHKTGQEHGMDPELVAAKLCGRWRNGVPLAVSPDSSDWDAATPPEKFNDFDYKDDPIGFKCPAGSHIRRNNPRNAFISGGAGLKHRIVRRGLPYGAAYDPNNPEDGIERGLVGLFICASLKDQFEFLMADWVNSGHFAPGISGTKDPILGNHTAADSGFVIPRKGQPPLRIAGFAAFVRTRGAAYCFLPSLSAVRFLARVSQQSALAAPVSSGG